MMPLILTLITAHIWMFGCWGIYQVSKKEVVADIAWSLGILLQGGIYYYFFAHHSIQTYFLLLLIVWSLRLSGFLFWNRILKPWHDKRYEKIIERSTRSSNETLFINYQIQATLQWVLGLAWFFIMQNQEFSTSVIIASSVLFFWGIGIEIMADEQLKRFKKDAKSHQVCQIGLWKYCRHPNYFGEIIIWLSFAIASHHLLGGISPLCLFLIMHFITGPLTEETSITHKGQSYLDYQKKTPMIWPYKLFSFKRIK